LRTKDYIVLTGLKVPCIIGIFDWERKIKQDVVIDLKFPCEIQRAAARDSIRETVDYKKIAKSVIAFVGKSKFQLVETLAEKLAAYLMDDLRLPEVYLSVSKPGAIRGSKNVGIEIHRTSSRGAAGFVFLGMGSNIEPKKHLEAALESIQREYPLAGLSHVYETSPVGFKRQPPFWNLVAAIQTDEEPRILRKRLERLEKENGRVKKGKTYGPRTLDVDLILWKNLVRKGGAFPLPHPDVESKAFVLFPLLEICPNLLHPSLGKPMVELAACFRDFSQKIRQLPADTFPEFPPRPL
jgi:2-amino-4-hydroxy-6-hydroxymethyldihydropteridine diphosphokinase